MFLRPVDPLSNHQLAVLCRFYRFLRLANASLPFCSLTGDRKSDSANYLWKDSSAYPLAALSYKADLQTLIIELI